MKKKIVTLLLVAAMTGTMVVGCGSKADDKTADTKTEQTDDKKDTEEKKELADDEYQYVFQRKSCKFRVVPDLPIGGRFPGR